MKLQQLDEVILEIDRFESQLKLQAENDIRSNDEILGSGDVAKSKSQNFEQTIRTRLQLYKISYYLAIRSLRSAKRECKQWCSTNFKLDNASQQVIIIQK